MIYAAEERRIVVFVCREGRKGGREGREKERRKIKRLLIVCFISLPALSSLPSLSFSPSLFELDSQVSNECEYHTATLT